MNIIQIVCDSVRKDFLGCYGHPWSRTPNIDRLAAESVVFEKEHTGSFPTRPNRTDMFTGRYAFRKYSWQPLAAEEVPLAAVLSAAGWKTQAVFNTPHLVADGGHYDRGFMGFTWIRGQEDENYRSSPRHPELPEPLEKYQEIDQYLRNVHLRKSEADYFPAQTFGAACAWLDEHDRDGGGPFFLHVDCFDPHEPWDPPMEYVRPYPHDPAAPFITHPLRGFADVFTAPEMKNIKALYAGELALVDKYIGTLLDKIDALGLRDSTAVIFTTDHGVCHDEHGIMGKFLPNPERTGVEQLHFYEEIAAIPGMIRVPGVKPRRTSALVQPVDMMATVLELTGLSETPPAKVSKRPRLFPAASVLTEAGKKGAEEPGFDIRKVNGRSLVPLLKGKTDAHRTIAVSGYSLKFPTPLRASQAITDGEWTLHYRGRYGDGKQKSAYHARFSKQTTGYRGETTPVLYHLPSDPSQDRNLLEKGVEMPAGVRTDPWKKAGKLHTEYVRFLEAIETPKEYLKPRKWWPKKK